jgi:trigger factor
VEAIAKINAIESTDEDVEKEIDSLAEKYSMTPEAVRQNFEERGGLDEMKYGILERKVFDHIVERSTLVEVESMEEKTA